jgi:hypothetical protein
MKTNEHIEAAKRALAPGGSDVETFMLPTRLDYDRAKTHALIAIAESLAELVKRES